MEYKDLVKKFENKESVTSAEVTGCQVFMLLRDRIITNVRIDNNLYEFNFISIADMPMDCVKITEQEFDTYYSIRGLMNFIITRATANKDTFICLDNEYFELKIEVLETRE